MSDTEELEHRERGSRGGCLLVGVIVLLAGYILSPPLLRLLMSSLPGPLAGPIVTVAQIVYFPLEWAYQNVEWVTDFYDWYMGLFPFP